MNTLEKQPEPEIEYQEIRDLKIVTSIEYIGRVLAVIEFKGISKTYRTVMYRSTGTNVLGKGMWFPCAGLAASNELCTTYMHTGWINKAYIYSSEDGIELHHSRIRNDWQHSDPRIRLANETFGMRTQEYWDISKLSSMVQELHLGTEPAPLISLQEFDADAIEFINTVVLRSLEYLSGPEEKEPDAKDVAA